MKAVKEEKWIAPPESVRTHERVLVICLVG